MQKLSQLILRLLGWKVAPLPELPDRFVLIGYPHTSNVDFFLAILTRSALAYRFQFVAKDSLFKGPLGSLMRALGGVPVDRSKPNGFIGQVADRFRAAKSSGSPMVIAMMPEGTRSYKPFWRSGFYYMALESKVPVVPAYLDFKTRTIGFGNVIEVSGDVEQDLAQLKAFYKDIEGRFPEKAAPIEFQIRD